MPDPTPETKPWYTSKTVIGAVVMVIATVLGLFGQPERAEVVQAESANISGIIASVVGLIGALVALYGRITAKKTLTT